MKLLLAMMFAVWVLSAQSTARVEGRITDGRMPLRGDVIIFADDGGVRIAPVATDAQGQFSVVVGIGRVLLVAKADGYVSQEREIVVSPGGGAPNVQFALAPAGSVSGRVFDQAGNGIAGARVWLDYRGESRHWRIAEEAGGDAADNFGNFTIPAVAQGRPFVLHAEGDGWLMSSSGTLNLRGAEMKGVVLLLSRRGTTVRGRVVDAAGEPVSGAEVHLRALANKDEFTAEQRGSVAFARSTNQTTTSAANGSYVFAGAPAGDVIVTAIAGNRRGTGQAVAVPGRDTEIVVRLR